MSDSKLTDLLRAAQKILIFSGAGISTGSGIPDYRGPQGVWRRHQPVYYQDFMTSETARLEYWNQKLEGWQGLRNAQPNAVHRSVYALEKAGKVETVVTQNIDGLHARAGTSADKLIELHGTSLWVECQMCHVRTDPDSHFTRFEERQEAPACDKCGGYLKPATISFGQSLRSEDLQGSADAAEACDLVIALGSTLSVYPAASVPLLAAERGVPYVIINRGPTDHDHHSAVTLRLDGDVVALFPPAVDAALSMENRI